MRVRVLAKTSGRSRDYWAFDVDLPTLPRIGECVLLDDDVEPIANSESGSRMSGDFDVVGVAHAYSHLLRRWRPGIRLHLSERGR